MAPNKRFVPDAQDTSTEPTPSLDETPTPPVPAPESASTETQNAADMVMPVDMPVVTEEELERRMRESAAAQAAQEAATPKPPVMHTVVPGDTLSDIAARYYDDAGRWMAIYEANKEVIGDNPNLIVVGQELIIPDL